MTTKNNDAEQSKDDLRNEEETQNEEDGLNVNKLIDPILDIQSGSFGIKKPMRSPEDGAVHSKRLRETEEFKKPKKTHEDDATMSVDESNEVQLSESIFMFPHKKVSQHGNVFEGEIRSGVYGIRSCVIKFAEISEQNVTEAKILGKLGSHTNVIAIVQSGTYSDILEDRFYIALDKCHEQNLRQYLENRKNAGTEFDLEQANGFARQIIDGIAYIHDNKVVHLDLKPSNILLSLNQRLIKIADFGLSREIKSTASKFHHKVQFGTDGYRPVESFGDGWVSLRSDIFSLGAVFYHLLSNGEEVFGDDEHKYIYNVKNNVRDTSRLLVSNPKTTEHLIKLMLSNERCRRPTIWQVAEHPCWTGKEVECDFDYGLAEEIDDSDVQIPEIKNQDSEDSETEAETHLKLAKALKRTEMMRRPVRKSSIIIFDENSLHLQCFNLRNNSITQMHEYNEKMKEGDFVSVSVDDHIYVFVKNRFMYRLDYCDLTATWERKADLIADHGLNPPAVSSSGSIIIAGGSDSTTTKSVTKYDPSLNRWEKIKDKQLETRDSANAASRGFVYCFGGFIDGIGVTDKVERLNIASQTWDEVASMGEAKYYGSAAECGGNLFVAGGRNRGDVNLNSVEKYDPDANQWTIMKPMIKTRGDFRCYVVGRNIYAVGHFDKGIEKYDLESDEWEEVQFPEANSLLIFESVLLKMKK